MCNVMRPQNATSARQRIVRLLRAPSWQPMPGDGRPGRTAGRWLRDRVRVHGTGSARAPRWMSWLQVVLEHTLPAHLAARRADR